MSKRYYPLYEVTPVGSVKEIMEIAVREAGDKIAFRYRDGDGIKDVTYAEFDREVKCLGTALSDMGLGNTHIAMLGENSYGWLVTYLTVLQSEGVFVPLDKDMPDADKINVINDSDSTVLFYSAKYESMLMENADKMPNIKYFIGIERDTDAGKFLSGKALIEKGAALLDGGNDTYLSMKSDPRALKLLVYTSGTTGRSKGVMLCEENLVSIVYYGMQLTKLYDTCLSVLPYHHTYEAVAGILVGLHNHTTICINENLKTVLRNIQLYKPDYIYLVPAFAEKFYKKIWDTARQKGITLKLKAGIKASNAMRKLGVDKRRSIFADIHETFGGNLKKIVCGGAPISAKIGKFFDSIGIELFNGYGITECSPLVSVNREELNNPATVGTVLPCCEVKFEDISAEGNGEICVKGPTVMLGYYKQPEATAEVLDSEGWFKTGDYGRMNAKNQLIITGRKKNIIVLDNGKNIYPEELEDVIGSIPYVEEVVVFGIRADGAERGLAAEVYLNEDKVKEMGITSPEEQIRRDTQRALFFLPAYKHVSRVYVRAFPFEKTTTNKIRRSSVIHK